MILDKSIRIHIGFDTQRMLFIPYFFIISAIVRVNIRILTFVRFSFNCENIAFAPTIHLNVTSIGLYNKVVGSVITKTLLKM